MATVKVFEVRNRVFVFSGTSQSGYSVSPQTSQALEISGISSLSGLELLTPGDVSVTIDHNLNDATTGILVMSNWNTSRWWAGQLANQITINLATPAVAGAIIYWKAVVGMASLAVVAGATSALITHNSNDASIGIFATPSWNTAVWDSTADRTVNTATLKFSTPVPAGGGILLWEPAS